MWARRRAIGLVLLLLVSAVGYAAFVVTLGLEPPAAVRRFGAKAGDDLKGMALDVYVEIITIDPPNDNMRLRVSFSPGPGLQGKRIGTLGHDVTVRTGDGTSAQEIDLHADQPLASQMIDTDLNDGVVQDYPFDRFTAKLSVTAFESPPGEEAPGTPIAVRGSLWDGVAGWTARATEEPATSPGGLTLDFSLRRTMAVTFMVSALYVVMMVIALASLTVAGGVFLRLRKLEVTLAGMLATMLFALPVMRYGLPGSPPIGVRADLIVYLWAQISTALSLVLFIGTWARGEPKPK